MMYYQQTMPNSYESNNNAPLAIDDIRQLLDRERVAHGIDIIDLAHIKICIDLAEDAISRNDPVALTYAEIVAKNISEQFSGLSTLKELLIYIKSQSQLSSFPRPRDYK